MLSYEWSESEFIVIRMFVGKYPLLSVFETGAVTQLPLEQQSRNLDLLKLFNDDNFIKPFSYWVKSLAIELFTFFNNETLASVASKQTLFSVSMVPLLVKALLTTKNKKHYDELNTAVKLFFSKTSGTLAAEPMEVEKTRFIINFQCIP